MLPWSQKIKKGNEDPNIESMMTQFSDSQNLPQQKIEVGTSRLMLAHPLTAKSLLL